MTKEQEEYIIEHYTAGETAVQIGKALNISNSAISRYVKKIGISRGRFSKRVLDIQESVKNDFINNHLYCEELAKKYKVDVHTIYKILDSYGIQRQSGYHSNCNEQYFSQIDTPNKAYILGFITADGAVVNGSLSMEINVGDQAVLDFMKQEINPNASYVYRKEKNTVRVSFCAKQLSKDLAKYGVIQNKSKIIEKVPIDLIPSALLPYYFRGLIDGDGCIHQDGKISIYSGSEKFIQSVQEILCKEAQVSKLSIYHGTTYFVSWGSQKDKILLYKYLYENKLNNTFYYPRKYNRLISALGIEKENTEVTL